MGGEIQRGSFFMKFIGDVHGHFSRYKNIIRDHPNTIQVGDMGVGFRRWPHGEWQSNPHYDMMVAQNAWFIRGNHDNPHTCRRHSQCIKDGHVETTKKGTKIMYIGGASSNDKEYRIEDFSWWPEEELSQKDMWEIAEKYAKEKPDVMVTHDCPIEIIAHIHSHHLYDNSRTQQFLQALFNAHKPKMWIHGHHHISFDRVINGTRFVCLAELEMKEFDI